MSFTKESICLTVFLVILSTVLARPQQQQQVDPAFLRDYYAQIQQQSARGASPSEATPIYEQQSAQPQSQPQYLTAGQQVRVRDSVSEQIRAQQQPQQFAAPAARQYFAQPQQQQQQQQQQQHQQQLQYQPQTFQQQNLQYSRPAPVKQTVAVAPRRPQQQYQAVQQGPRSQKEYDEDESDDGLNSSYQFGFDVKDDEFTNYQNRKEVRDGNVIKGSYSVVDSDGFIRTVTYTADPKEGFKADVVREPTDIVVKVPTPAPDNLIRGHSQSQPQYASGQYRALPRPQAQQQQQPQAIRQQSQQQYQQYE